MSDPTDEESAYYSSQFSGYLFGFIAFGIWGLFPLFWKLVAHVDALEVLSHRILWSVPFCALVLAIAGWRQAPWSSLRSPAMVAALAASTCLISANWGIYIWAVSNDQVLQASLGYFMSPLFNILAGLLLFRERLRPLAGISVAFALVGVTVAAVGYGAVPWIGLLLALSFGGYGALRKLSSLDSISGLFLETLLISPVAIIYLIWLDRTTGTGFLAGSMETKTALVLAGAVTATPLLFYVGAARRLPMTTLGMLFYLAPSMLFVMATLVYDEPVRPSDWIVFGCIWGALGLYSWDLHRGARARRLGAAAS